MRAPETAEPVRAFLRRHRTSSRSLQSAIMSTQPNQTLETAAPPAAKPIPTKRTHHGDTFVDEYAWPADKENRDTIAFLEAQNAYTGAMTAGQAGLRDAIFGEIKGRTKETDLSVPTRRRGWWYYSPTVEGQQYALHCRRVLRDQNERPPLTEDDPPPHRQERLLNG